MPKRNGLSLLDALKSNPKTKDIPLIFITALTDIEDKHKGLELGAVDYISKPFDIKEVIMKAKNILKTSILFNLQTPTDIGSYIIDYVISKKDHTQIKNLNKKIESVTPDHIKQFAKKVFIKSNLFIVINGPNKITNENLEHLVSEI
jgi:response regulator RpfG family c-di-GMP phosphodiesterase